MGSELEVPSFTMELTQSHTGDMQYLTVEDYRNYGEGTVKAIYDYFEFPEPVTINSHVETEYMPFSRIFISGNEYYYVNLPVIGNGKEGVVSLFNLRGQRIKSGIFLNGVK
jgi:hypothetical protein